MICTVFFEVDEELNDSTAQCKITIYAQIINVQNRIVGLKFELVVPIGSRLWFWLWFWFSCFLFSY